ncbi:MAG: hypothetical protein ALECFALPRED_005908 [Alectoria fallacina]|uniref:Uncharacterized protein n=1 Tax=Alectoria fallacina TaxID=1903189 RepID=A0A8H3G712_9LECA|nr:MAG: hypothetical protein ALECFALPRED_005908 [Alectoria fallacina]
MTLISQRGTNTSSDCANPEKDLTPACYDDLLVDANLEAWWDENQVDCETNYADYGFGSCFQQKMGKYVLLDQQCNGTSPGQCTGPGNFTSYEPWVYYTLTSVFGVWQWFKSIYYASDFANGIASDRVGNITRTLNPLKPEDPLDLTQLLLVISAAVGLIAAPASAALTFGSIIQQGIPRGVDPVVNELLFTGTLESQVLDFDQIEAQLSDVIVAFQSNVANSLNTILSNFTSFREFARHGAYIAPDANLNASTTILTQYLTTWVVSKSLGSRYDNVVFWQDTNPYDLRHNGSLPSKQYGFVNCQDPPDSYGVCDRWYFNGRDSYQLRDGLANSDVTQYSLMETMFREGWTTGQLLFDGALSCAVHTAVTSDAPDTTINATNLQPQCLSNLFMLMAAPELPSRPGQTINDCFWALDDLGSSCSGYRFDYLYAPYNSPTLNKAFDILPTNLTLPITNNRVAIEQFDGPVNAYLDSLGM